jgi:hypothetical protein
VCAILPFNIDLNGARLTYATTQLVTRLEHAGAAIYVFFAPEGVDAEYCFERNSLVDLTVECGAIEDADRRTYVSVEPGKRCLMHLKTASGDTVMICTLTRHQALQLWKVDVWGRERLILSEADLLAHNGMLELLSAGNPEIRLSMFPAVEGLFGPDGWLEGTADGLFMDYCVSLPAQEIPFSVIQVSAAKAVVRLSPDAFRGVADITLAIRYRGDVGYAAIDGRLISDNFANGAAWEIGLRRFTPRILERNIDLYIAPLREGQIIASDSGMAMQQTFVGQEIAQIDSIEAIPHYQVRLTQHLTHA